MPRLFHGLGHSLELEIVAEGVETMEQADHLQKLNCDIYQGFYYCKPLASNGIEDLFAAADSDRRNIELS